MIHEDAFKQNQVKNNLSMVVIGGGTAALEAATTAAEVGVQVTLFEEKSYLGGLAREIARLPDKKRIDDYVVYLEERAKQLPNLTIHLNTRADLKTIEMLAPDIIVNATGAKPLLPPIKGLKEQLENPNRQVFSIFDLLNNMENFEEFEGKRIAVIGGGAVGLDVVEYYAERGAAEVSIVEMQEKLGKDLDLITRISMMDMIKRHGVQEYTETALTEVCQDHFKVKQAGKESEIPFDIGFVCLGMRGDSPMMEALLEYGKATDTAVVNIGDSKVARRIIEGTREARDILTTIHQVDRSKPLSQLKLFSGNF